MDFARGLIHFLGFTVGTASVRILLLAALAGGIALIVRRRGAEVRHAVWTVVLGAMLVMPMLPLVVPPMAAPRWARTLEWPLTPRIPAPVPSSTPQYGTVMTVTASGRISVDQGTRPAPLTDRRTGIDLLISAYCLIAAIASLRVVIAVRRATGLVERAETLEDDRLREMMRVISLEQGTGYPLPRVAESVEALVPFTAGWQDPAIVLPLDWRGWSEFKQRAVLSHEMAHMRRGDWLIALAAAFNQAIFWFHPLAWWLRRKLAGLAEEACDGAAMANVGDGRRYAGVVLDFAAVMAASGSRLSWEATAMARSSKVVGRIERILEGELMWSQAMTKTAWVVLLALALPVLYAASALEPFEPPALSTGTFGPLPPSSTVVAGGDMTAAEAAMLEARVTRNSRDIDARLLITGYYFRHAATEQYRQQLLWMVENAPESYVHDTMALATGSNGSLLIDAAMKAQLAELWQKQAALHPADPMVLVHAARFFREGDPEAALPFYLRAREVAPENLNCIEELVTLHVTAVAITEGQNRPSPELLPRSERIRAALEKSDDAELLGRSAIRLGPPRFHPSQNIPPAIRERMEELSRTRTALARTLLERAHALAPADERWPRALARLDAGEPLFERPQEPEKPVSSSLPVYPALAKLGRVQGNVMVELSVRSDGSVSEATLMGGHPLLAKAALEAVKSWKFAARPAEQRIMTMVEFRLPADSVSPSPASAAPVQTAGTTAGGIPPRISVGGNVQQAMLTESPAPVYPPLARQARISGTVRFKVIIGKDGSVANMTLASGHPLLIQAAQEAVQAYRYKPTLLNGNPVEVETEVNVNFQLSN
ncbi:M56 family metallopeptidase [Paludibaculum fermentans]|uniref:M56 family metallopeptidase n=1 Tax=Paludibaculum fermentans TaxID=1473598 RepID=UPI003EBABF6D